MTDSGRGSAHRIYTCKCSIGNGRTFNTARIEARHIQQFYTDSETIQLMTLSLNMIYIARGFIVYTRLYFADNCTIKSSIYQICNITGESKINMAYWNTLSNQRCLKIVFLPLLVTIAPHTNAPINSKMRRTTSITKHIVYPEVRFRL